MEHNLSFLRLLACFGSEMTFTPKMKSIRPRHDGYVFFAVCWGKLVFGSLLLWFVVGKGKLHVGNQTLRASLHMYIILEPSKSSYSRQLHGFMHWWQQKARPILLSCWSICAFGKGEIFWEFLVDLWQYYNNLSSFSGLVAFYARYAWH